MARNERFYGSIEEPYCYLCSRPTDHAGEHTQDEEIRFVGWNILEVGVSTSPDDRPDWVPNLREFIVALKSDDTAAIRTAIVNLFEAPMSYLSSGAIADMELVLNREWKVAS